MADNIYPMEAAVADLRQAGLAVTVLAPGSKGTLVEDTGKPVGGFLGAGIDSRSLEPGQLFAALAGENVHGRRFAPDVLARGHWVLTDRPDAGPDPLTESTAPGGAGALVTDDPTAALGVLASAWRDRFTGTVLGVTGTNGKTTTKDLMAALLGGAGPTLATAGNYNNLLGVPLTLLALRADHAFAVIEMGASAVGDIDRLAALVKPRVGVITNASPAHLAEFGSLEGIIEGKGELLDHLPSDGRAILNLDSLGFETWRARASCPVVTFGCDGGDHPWSWRPVDAAGRGETLIDGKPWSCPMPGRHNGANLAAAVLAVRAAGVSDDQSRRGLEGFQGSAHRGIVTRVEGRTVLDDSYNANPGSVVAACRALVEMAPAGRAFAVLGHMAEMGDDSEAIHRDTGREAAAAGLETLVAVGPLARAMIEGFDEGGGSGHYCATREEAARLLADITAPGDRLLIKGSRSAAMEDLLPLLESSFRSH